ncbi:MAG: TonB family protein [Bacteroidaceae bacterium]|nr:TonB family protein [Bacteroidaceae bacterium]
MGAFIVYLIKSSLLLAMLVSLFMLFMSRETFHKLNRYLLLCIVVVSLVLPFVNVGMSTPLQGVFDFIENGDRVAEVGVPVVDVLPMYETTEQPVVMADAVPVMDVAPVPIEGKGSAAPLWQIIVLAVYVLGVVLLVIRQLVMYVQLSRLIMRSRKATAEQYGLDDVKLRLHSGEEKPFSWFGWVVVSNNDMAEGAHEILTHEAAHVRAGHSRDIMLVDAVIIMQWFNPLAWIMKNTLKDIHEFEADEAVISSGVNAKQYQLLIIKKAVGARLYSIANSFNHSLTKKRITMMCKEKSNKWSRAKALYILPVAAIAALSFSTAENANAEPTGKVNEIVSDDTISGVEKNSKVTSLKLPAGKEWMYAHLCYVDGSTGNNESVCIAYIRGAEGENVGYFRGTTDEFDNAREGYAPGYFVVPLRNVKLDKNVMTFSIYADDATILRNPVKCSECGIVNAVNNGELWKNDASYFKSKKADFKLILGPRSVLQNLTNPYVGGERVLGGVEIDYVYDNTSDELADDNPDKIHQVVEIQPEFPGGMKEMMKFIQYNLKYPESAKAAGTEGKAFVQFVVKADGSIENVEIMRSSGDASLDAEALRVVKAMPKWRPAMNKGEAVNVKFVLPIVYKLPKEVNGNGIYMSESNKENLLVVSGGAIYDGDINDIDPVTIESVEIVKFPDLTPELQEKLKATGKEGVMYINIKKEKSNSAAGNEAVFTVCEKMPEFPGGQQELMKYLSRNIKFPQTARDAEVMGKVFVRFLVNKEGAVVDANVLKGEYSKYVYSAEAISLKNHIAKKQEELEILAADGVSIDILRRRGMELQELQVQAYSSIEKNGGRTEVKVEAGDAAVKALEAEAVRVVSSMPAWNPGMQGGKPVNTQYVLPIVFRLN